jgi:BirA family transcriptional regulator, biotin operon repressor / biotin---[acetyl-CoA-carboxylase] ligase
MGKKIISLPSCESTNTVLASLADTNRLEEGSVVITENQTKGRGQAGNQWLTEAGANLTFSVLLKPVFLEPGRQFFLNMVVGLAVCDTIKSVAGLPALVKWPNDVLVNDKKVCGILIENQLHGQQFVQAVVGIGLNVNQEKFVFDGAASLKNLSNRNFDKSIVLNVLLESLEERYRQLKKGALELLTAQYHEQLYRRAEQHAFESDGKEFLGIITGVDDIGRLCIDTDKGERKFNFKEVRFIQ